MNAQIHNISNVVLNGPTINFNIELDSSYAEDVYKALRSISSSHAKYFLELKQKQKRRSLNSNAYLWILCDKIAKAVGTTKEIVYQKNVREVGSFDVVEIAEGEAVDRFIQRWCEWGIGYLAERIGEARPGFVNVIAYYGSSSYDSKEMSRLLDSVISEAKNLGIETLSEEEIFSLNSSWKGEKKL